MNWLQKLLNLKTKPISPTQQPGFWPWAGIPAKDRLAPNESQCVSVFSACVRIISDAFAASPFEVHSIGPDGTRVVLGNNDSIHWLLNFRPNRATTARALKHALMQHALVYGDGYLEVEKDGYGKVLSIQHLPSDRMGVFLHGDPEVPVGLGEPYEKVFRYTGAGGQVEWLTQDRVVQVQGPTDNSLTGLGQTLRAARQAAIAYAQDTFVLAHYSQGAYPAGVLNYDGVYKSEDDRKRAREEFNAAMQAARNAGKGLLLEKGYSWQAIPATNIEQSMVIMARQFSVEEIARIFGVPLHLLMVLASSQGYGTNIETVGIEFVRQTLEPWKQELEQELTYKLLSERSPKYICIDLSRLTRGDAKTRAEADRIRIESGVLSVNEVRHREGLDSIGPEGDLHLVSSSLTLLDEEVLAPQEAAAEAPSGPPGDVEDQAEGATTPGDASPSDTQAAAEESK